MEHMLLIVVIARETDIRRRLAPSLARAGYEAEFFEGLAAALQCIGQRFPAAVLIDPKAYSPDTVLTDPVLRIHQCSPGSACILLAEPAAETPAPAAGEWVGWPHPFAIGKLQAILGKAAQKTLGDYAELYQIFLNGCSATMVMNAGFKVIRINRAFEPLFDVEQGRILGRNCYEVMPNPLCHTSLCLLNRIRRGSDTARGEFAVDPAQGDRIYCAVTATPFRAADGALGGIIANFSDITDHKRLERERRQVQTQLLQAQKMQAIGTLAGGIAHDFNNILGAIIGYSEIANFELNETCAPKDCLAEVLKAAQRAKELVNQILAFSRQKEPEFQPLQVAPLVKETLKLLRASLPTTIDIRQRIEASGATVQADPTQIHQVVMNLSTNAAHAMDRGGVLSIGLRKIDLTADHPASPCEGDDGGSGAFADDGQWIVYSPDPITRPGSYLELSVAIRAPASSRTS